MKKFEPFIQDLFDHSKAIPFSQVTFSQEVRKLCEQNMCGNFRKSWTCPPAVDSIEDLQGQLSLFHRFLLLDKVYPLQDSFDWEGMQKGGRDFQSRILKLKKRIKKADPGFEFLALGAGACKLCDTCTYGQQEPCRNPEDAIVSVEAYGIEVMKLMKEAGLSYNNGPDTVTYIGGIFYE
ncbi:DUF2284 domain-containing protein [Desulfospira joergensenii]|uniref:DUF2284 domain-containing protein n=1 Tax=Desulfospira joergensenii TaxID=53329 RepID=UPI0003B60400|nr:DUF2284 domain-containing protein [Desulfospira joergensenii]